MPSIFVPALSNALCHKKFNLPNNSHSYDFKYFTEKSFFKYPYVLASTFYQLEYNIDNFREYFSYPSDYTIIADSGGFQLATFYRDNKPFNYTPLQILRWMENNSNIGMNLDVPPWDNFSAALKKSVENFQFFEDNRLNYDFKLYNILHGNSFNQLRAWYAAVKDFNFDGWALGVKPTNNIFLQLLGYLYLNEQNELVDNFHLFGVSSLKNMITLAYISRVFDKNITFDSSSYDTGSRFRKFYFPKSVRYSIDFGRDYLKSMKSIPCDCPVCSNISIYDFYDTGEKGYMLLPLHNLYQFIEVNKYINYIATDDYALMKYCKSVNETQTIQVLKSIITDFENHNCEYIYNKYKNYMIIEEPKFVSKNLGSFGVLL